MCGRFSLSQLLPLLQALGIAASPEAWPARYNIAPTQAVPAVLDPENRKLEFLRWGLVPQGAEGPAGRGWINARSETADAKPAFRKAFRSRRCWVLADSYYEWRRTPQGKVPYRIVPRAEEPFVFAGLWEAHRDPGTRRPVQTCAVLTTQAHPSLDWIHGRMPVMLDVRAAEVWLDRRADPGTLKQLLRPWDSERLEAYPVSTRVNSPANDDAALWQRAGNE